MESLSHLLSNPVFAWVGLPVLIFMARIGDVSLDTVRIICLAKGVRLLAAILGFIQVMIWLLAINTAMKHMDNPICFLAYAAGFGAGNLVGVHIEEWLSLGKCALRVITQKDAAQLVAALRAENFIVTNLAAEGVTGPVQVIFTVAERKRLGRALDLVREFNPKAFYTIEDIRSASAGGRLATTPTARFWPREPAAPDR